MASGRAWLKKQWVKASHSLYVEQQEHQATKRALQAADDRLSRSLADLQAAKAQASSITLADLDTQECPSEEDCRCLEDGAPESTKSAAAAPLAQLPEEASKQPGDASVATGVLWVLHAESMPALKPSQQQAARSKQNLVAAYQRASADSRVCPCARECCCPEVASCEELDTEPTRDVVTVDVATDTCNFGVEYMASHSECPVMEQDRCEIATSLRILQQRAQEAVKEKELMANTCASMLSDLEAATKLLGEEGVPLAGQPEDRWDSAGDLHDLRPRFTLLVETISKSLQQVQKAKEVLSRVLCCSLSLDVFRTPMLAPDGQVYEQKNILTWLKENPTSPLTRMPMRPNELLHDRVVQQATEALWLLLGKDPHKVEEKVEASQVRWDLPKTTAIGLHEAIVGRDEALALDMLAQSGQIAGLNDRYGEEKATLLHLSLLHELPSVAEAIIKHPFFHKHDASMGAPIQAIRALHIAASMGLLSACQALLQRCGGDLAIRSIPHKMSLTLSPSGRQLTFERDYSAIEMAWLGGHSQIVQLLEETLETLANHGH